MTHIGAHPTEYFQTQYKNLQVKIKQQSNNAQNRMLIKKADELLSELRQEIKLEKTEHKKIQKENRGNDNFNQIMQPYNNEKDSTLKLFNDTQSILNQINAAKEVTALAQRDYRTASCFYGRIAAGRAALALPEAKRKDIHTELFEYSETILRGRAASLLGAAICAYTDSEIGQVVSRSNFWVNHGGWLEKAVGIVALAICSESPHYPDLPKAYEMAKTRVENGGSKWDRLATDIAKKSNEKRPFVPDKIQKSKLSQSFSARSACDFKAIDKIVKQGARKGSSDLELFAATIAVKTIGYSNEEMKTKLFNESVRRSKAILGGGQGAALLSRAMLLQNRYGQDSRVDDIIAILVEFDFYDRKSGQN